MNFKFYYKESLLRQCFFRQQRNNNQYGYTNTGKTELFMEIKKNFPTYHKQGSLNHKFQVLL
nr:MAG TPA: Chloramphenicol phosphotransferase-like protein [Caudoviricetes sp.]